MSADLVQRSRAGDRGAFAGLVGLWGDRALQLALSCRADPTEASEAVAAAFVVVYRDLPGLHTRRAFRPWLGRLVLIAAGARPRDERLRTVLTEATGARAERRADAVLRSVLSSPPRLRLPEGFFADQVEDLLTEPEVLVARRPCLDPVDALRALGSEGFRRAATPAASVRIEDAWRQQGYGLGWIATEHVSFRPASLESVWDANIVEETVVVRLRGIAVPGGLVGRALTGAATELGAQRASALARACDTAFGATGPASAFGGIGSETGPRR